MDIFSKIDEKESQMASADIQKPKNSRFKRLENGRVLCVTPAVYHEGEDLKYFVERSKVVPCLDTSRKAQKNAKLFMKLAAKYEKDSYNNKGKKILEQMKALLEGGINFNLLTEEEQRYLLKTVLTYQWEILYQAGYDFDSAWQRGIISSKDQFIIGHIFRYVSDLNLKDPYGYSAFECTDCISQLTAARTLNVTQETVDAMIEHNKGQQYSHYRAKALFDTGNISLSVDQLEEIVRVEHMSYTEVRDSIIRDACEYVGINPNRHETREDSKTDIKSAEQEISKLFSDVEKTI